ncbi:MAG: hypothetical protein ACQEWE_18020 [Bacillota bacterium]
MMKVRPYSSSIRLLLRRIQLYWWKWGRSRSRVRPFSAKWDRYPDESSRFRRKSGRYREESGGFDEEYSRN